MSADTRSPVRQAALDGILQCRHFVAGEAEVKAQGKTYLNPFSPTMSDDAYKLYKKEAQVGGITGAMHSSVTGALLRRPPIVVLPTGSEWIQERFGDRGQGLLLWMAETLDSHVTSGNDWVLIDFPQVNEVLSRAEEEALGINPYPVHIAAESILDSTSTMVGSKEVLTELRYERSEFVAQDDEESFSYDEVKTVTRLFLKGGLAYRRDYVDNKAVTGEIPFQLAGTQLTFLPVFSLNGRVNPIIPLLLAMATLDYHLYNKKSRRNHYNYVMGTSTLVTSGVPAAQAEELNELGGRWDLGAPEAKAYSIGVDPNVINGSKTVIDEDYSTASSYGARMFADDTREAESAEALAIKNASSHATIGHLATVFGQSMVDIITFVIYWQTGIRPVDGDVQIELSKDFVPAVLNGNDLTALVNASVQNKIPNRVLFDALVKGELIADGMTFEDFETSLSEQAFEEPVVTAGQTGDTPL